jgi:hypothetical protein
LPDPGLLFVPFSLDPAQPPEVRDQVVGAGFDQGPDVEEVAECSDLLPGIEVSLSNCETKITLGEDPVRLGLVCPQLAGEEQKLRRLRYLSQALVAQEPGIYGRPAATEPSVGAAYIS